MKRSNREALIALIILIIWISIVSGVFFGIYHFFGWTGIAIFILAIPTIIVSVLAIKKHIRAKDKAMAEKLEAEWMEKNQRETIRKLIKQRNEFSIMSVKEIRRKIVAEVVSFEQQHGFLYGVHDKKERLREQVISRLNDQFAWEKKSGLTRTGRLLDGMDDDVVIYDYSAADWEEADSSER